MDKIKKQVLNIRSRILLIIEDFSDIISDVTYPHNVFAGSVPKFKITEKVISGDVINYRKYFSSDCVHLPTLQFLFGKHNLEELAELLDLDLSKWEDIVKIHIRLKDVKATPKPAIRRIIRLIRGRQKKTNRRS